MHFSLSTILAIVPLLVSASPLTEQPRVTIPLSRRSDLSERDGFVDLDKLREHRGFAVAKIMNGFNNYQKNTGQRHPIQPDVVSTGSKRAVGKDPLTDYFDNLWYGPISVGTPAKSFTVHFDTGLSEFFLPGSTCIYSCNGHTLYDPDASSTSKPLGTPFHLQYVNENELSGTLYTDNVTVAGLTATNQTMGVADDYYFGFASEWFPADGLMGLAFQSISQFKAPSVFETLVSQGQTTSGIFAFKFASSGSELSIGGLNHDLYSNTPTYTPVTEKGHWQIEFSALKVGDTTVVKSTPAIVDSGTPFILGPQSAVAEFYDKIPGSAPDTAKDPGLYTFPCNATLPTISFTIGGKDLSLPASAFISGPIGNGTFCVGSITPDDGQASKFWILGYSFMRNYYTIFDYDNSRVGFATLK